MIELSAWIVLVGYVLCLLVSKRPVAVIFLVTWPRGDGVPGRHPRHLFDPNITDHRTASTWGVPVVQSLLILTTTKRLERTPMRT